MTDSEQVPWGKGEKFPDKGGEIETETVHLQAVEALWRAIVSATAYLLHYEPASYVYVARLSREVEP